MRIEREQMLGLLSHRGMWIVVATLTSIIASAALGDDRVLEPAWPAIIPQPEQVDRLPGGFMLDDDARVIVGTPELLEGVAQQLIAHIATQTGVTVPIAEAGAAPTTNDIVLRIRESAPLLGEEGYQLSVTRDGVLIEGHDAAGVFYGVQTFRQLLPWEASGEGVQIPSVRIHDRPRYRWRGMMLDVGRHFFDVEFVKRLLDVMALHKMNRFHWHLTEDQGWRIDIEQHPLLSRVGGFRRGEGGEWYPDGSLRGGYYTRDEIREIVDYAHRRFITVVPEIEMPGHAQAALAVRPDLSCTGGPFHVSRRWGVHKDIFCAGREETFEFLGQVLDEVNELFPGPYVHIGGDEAPKDRWRQCARCQARIREEGLVDEHELQSYFIRRIERHLASRGKRLIGWDEILEGGLPANATVMSWRGTDGGIAAARAGHDVVMSPHSHLYFDYDPSDHPQERGAFTPPITLRQVYSFEPTPPTLTSEQARHVLGAQGNLWTEQIATPAGAEYMAVPRLCALAEVVWSSQAVRDWNSFQRRLGEHYARLDAMGIRYRVPMPRGEADHAVFQDSATIMLRPAMPHGVVRYTLDGSDPKPQSPALLGRLRLTESAVVSARTFLPDGRSSLTRTIHLRKMDPLPDVAPQALKQGLAYRVYRGRFRQVPETAPLNAVSTGVTDRLGLLESNPGEDYVVEFTGYLRVEKTGEYHFNMQSNDGCRLWIDGQLVAENPGAHWTREREGSVLLAEGWHRLRMVFCQAWGEQALQVRWAGPGFGLEPLPPAALAHDRGEGDGI